MKYHRPNDVSRYRAPGPERLRELAAFLDDIPDGKLTFSRWYGHGKGCAVGLAARECLWMQAQGLRLENAANSRVQHPAYDGLTDWPAVVAFFDIPLETAQALFSVSGYEGNLRPSPRAVSARIRAHLRADAPVPARDSRYSLNASNAASASAP